MGIMLLQKPKEIVPTATFLKKLHQSTKKSLNFSLLSLYISLSLNLSTLLSLYENYENYRSL